jgi:hypothetical protein
MEYRFHEGYESKNVPTGTDQPSIRGGLSR